MQELPRGKRVDKRTDCWDLIWAEPHLLLHRPTVSCRRYGTIPLLHHTSTLAYVRSRCATMYICAQVLPKSLATLSTLAPCRLASCNLVQRRQVLRNYCIPEAWQTYIYTDIYMLAQVWGPCCKISYLASRLAIIQVYFWIKYISVLNIFGSLQ